MWLSLFLVAISLLTSSFSIQCYACSRLKQNCLSEISFNKIRCPQVYDACHTLFDNDDRIIITGCDFYKQQEKTCHFNALKFGLGAKSDFTRCQCKTDFCNNLDAFSLDKMAME